MGKAARWLKGLFGLNKDKDPRGASDSGHRRDEKRWSFGHSRRDSGGLCQNPATIPPNITPAEAAWLRSRYTDTEKEQNKHAIAVAAATAAAADAAIVAAQAAVAVVRLTSHGRGTMFGGGHERLAAVKIQSVFRGYLARKAHRALKGLVRLQALVRGFLVRKQADATFHCMQALLRAQAMVRSQRARSFCINDARFPSETRAPRSSERFYDARSEDMVSIQSRRLSSTLDTAISAIDESPKIVEVDTGRPKSRSRRANLSGSDFGDDSSSSQLLSSCLPFQNPAPISISDGRNFPHLHWALTGDECRFSTAQSTPRFSSSGASNAPLTPAKSARAADRQCSNFPNYMANTKSSKAKLRSHSAPKQRPEPGPKRVLSLSEMMECRNSLGGVRMQRSCSQSQDSLSFKNVVMGRIERSVDLGSREVERSQLQRRWE